VMIANDMIRKCTAEYLGTFLLVLAGTTAIVVDDLSGGAITQLGIALVFGLAVAAMIYVVGDISGAHINPAVTIGMWYAKRFDGKQVGPYVVSQIAGALSASAVVALLFTTHPTLGATVPSGTSAASFGLEALMTWLLMLTVITLVAGSRSKRVVAAAAGLVVGLEAWVGGPISGASMNPARSIGPAVFSGHLTELWIYILAPIIGACLAIVCCRCVKDGECCG
jgi:aquaporin NIP